MDNEWIIAVTRDEIIDLTELDQKIQESGYLMNTENTIAPPWQPIETAPKDGDDVFVRRDDHYAIASWNGSEWRDHGDIGWGGMDGEDNQPTHWLPKKYWAFQST